MDRAKLREDLVAYVDGELPAAEAREIEAWLGSDPEAEELRRHLQEDALALRGLFGAVLREPVPEALSARIGAPAGTRAAAGAAVVGLPQRARPRPMGPWLAAASIACLVLGGVAGFYGGDYQARQEIAAMPAQPPSWIMQVAQYHRVYAGEKRHLVEVAAEETPHIEAWLGKRLELPFRVPDLSAFGLTFKGARMLVINGEPVAQLIYLPADGRAFALCVIRSKREDKPLTASQQDDLNLVDWREKGYGFVAIGWEDQAELRAIAEASQKDFLL
jgi:anti-sigma factor RsiW